MKNICLRHNEQPYCYKTLAEDVVENYGSIVAQRGCQLFAVTSLALIKFDPCNT